MAFEAATKIDLAVSIPALAVPLMKLIKVETLVNRMAVFSGNADLDGGSCSRRRRSTLAVPRAGGAEQLYSIGLTSVTRYAKLLKSVEQNLKGNRIVQIRLSRPSQHLFAPCSKY